jgi:hypothetical protein
MNNRAEELILFSKFGPSNQENPPVVHEQASWLFFLPNSAE